MEYKYIKTITFESLKENEGAKFEIDDRLALALFLVDNKVYAFDNKCPHMGMPLCEGRIENNENLVCRYHFWKFNIKTGNATFAPSIYAKTFETKIDDTDGFVYVKIPA